MEYPRVSFWQKFPARNIQLVNKKSQVHIHRKTAVSAWKDPVRE
jgi:hypothetical protein